VKGSLLAREYLFKAEIRLDVDTVEDARGTAIDLDEDLEGDGRMLIPSRCAVSSDSIAR
jgi:hypothetical protein